MKVLTGTWWSSSVNCQKSVTVLLPADYSAASRPLPVVYLLHGYGGNRWTWLRRSDLAGQVTAGGVIVVLPESGRSWLINDVRGRRYEDYLLNEVITYIDGRFSTAACRAGRAIAGFSMGGACAFFHLMRRGDLFSLAASHSGAFEAPLRDGDPYLPYRADRRCVMPTTREHERVWGPVGSAVRRTYDPYRLISARNPALPVRMYLDVGQGDYERVISMNRNMRDALAAHAVPHEYCERPGGHDWEFVNSGLPRLFGFLRAHLVSS